MSNSTTAETAEFALEKTPAGERSAEKRHVDSGQNGDHGRQRETNLKERRWNVYENKGSALHSPERSPNVIENTSSYEFIAGILLKRKDEQRDSGFRIRDSGVGSQDSGVRSQESGVVVGVGGRGQESLK